VAKGEIISSFPFGGLDIVMLFERRSNVIITAQVGIHDPVRSQCATAHLNKLLF